MTSLICSLTGFMMWVLAYMLIIIRSFRRGTYGMNIVAICFNVSWDLTFAFLRNSDLLAGTSDPFVNPQILNAIARIFCTIWAFADMVMIYQVIRNGSGSMPDSWRKRHVYIYSMLLVATGIACIHFSAGMFRTSAIHCLAWGLVATVVVSLSYVFMALSRENLRGQSLSGALLRLVGIQLICGTLIRFVSPSIALIFMPILLVADLGYIGLLARWCRERRVSIWTLL